MKVPLVCLDCLINLVADKAIPHLGSPACHCQGQDQTSLRLHPNLWRLA